MIDEHMRFALNSAVDTLPHSSNLALWKKRESDACILCGERQTLIHVLNACPVARDDRRLNFRHNALLIEIAAVIAAYLPCTANLTVDTGSYTFPQHTDLRPDIIYMVG